MKAKAITVAHRDGDIFEHVHAHCQLVATLPNGTEVSLPAGTVLHERVPNDGPSIENRGHEAEIPRSPRYLARAQHPDGTFENVSELTTLAGAKRLALSAQEKRGGPVHVVDEGSEVVWSSEIDAVIFEPTADELDGCASLAKLTGLPMRTLVIALSHQLASLRLTRDELSKANGELREEVEHAQRRAREAQDAVARLAGASLDLARAAPPQRLRAGPWVEVRDTYTGGASERRHNMFGGSAGNIAETSSGWVWFVAVPFAAPEEGGDGDGLSRDQARAIVDDKLRKNFDLAADPAKETP